MDEDFAFEDEVDWGWFGVIGNLLFSCFLSDGFWAGLVSWRVWFEFEKNLSTEILVSTFKHSLVWTKGLFLLGNSSLAESSGSLVLSLLVLTLLLLLVLILLLLLSQVDTGSIFKRRLGFFGNKI